MIITLQITRNNESFGYFTLLNTKYLVEREITRLEAKGSWCAVDGK